MTRGLSAPNLAAAGADVVRPVNFIELEYESAPVRANSTNMTFPSIDVVGSAGDPFTGVGKYGTIKTLTETAEQRGQRMVAEISGVDPALIAIALGERYRNRPGRWYRGYLNEDFALVDVAHLWFEGRIDTQRIRRGAKGTITVTIVDDSVRWEKPLDAPTFDDAFQQSRRPGDLFFQFVPQLVNGKEIFP